MLKGLVRLAVVSSFSSDDKAFPIHKIEYMGKVADAVAWYPYGFHANPGPDALAIFFAIGGNSESRVFLPGSPEDRIDDLLPTPLAENEVLLYHPPTKSYIHFKEDGTIDIDSQKDVNIRAIGNMVAAVEGNLDVDAKGTVDIDSVGKTTITGAGTVKIDGATLLDLVANLVKVNDGGLAEFLLNEAFLALFNLHTHTIGNPPTQQASVSTHTTDILKSE